VNRILIATDFSADAQRAADHGVALARFFGAPVELVSSVMIPPTALYPGTAALPPDFIETIREQVQERLESMAAELRAEGLTASVHLAWGEPSSALCERAEQVGADLITLGTRGRTGLPHVVLGSVAERTVRMAPCPVLTAHADSPAPGDVATILVPTDFSSHADAALEWVRPVLSKTGARLILLHAYHLPRGLESAALALDERITLAIEAEVERRFEGLRGDAAGELEFVLRRDSPDVAALEVAQEYGADLIVIGTRGRSGLAHVLLGSTAERVIRNSAAPVVSLKASD
jgi:nucleotide-binding universal stress UspA family protein